jgi:quercetin dioxygenase-like cupin family protein
VPAADSSDTRENNTLAATVHFYKVRGEGDAMTQNPASGLNQVASEMPPGRAVTLAAMTDYVAGSVVSRTLVKNPAGTITVFAFDAGEGLSEHTAKYDALVQVLDGEVLLTIGGKEVPAVAGESVLMPANVPHALHASTPFKMLLTMIRG